MAREKRVKIFRADSAKELTDAIYYGTPDGYSVHKVKSHIIQYTPIRDFYSITVIFKENKTTKTNPG